MQVLVLQGSLNSGVNAALERAVREALGDGVQVTRFEGLDRLPFYRESLDAAGADPAVDAFRAAVTAADAVIAITPEHNGMPSAVLKNALDLASRPRGAGALAGKPVAVLAASPSPMGGGRAAAALVTGFQAAQAAPLTRVVTVPGAHTKLVDGAYTDEVRAEVAGLVAELLGASV